MSPRNPAPPDDDDPGAAGSADDGARAESAWLVARDHDPGAPPPSPQLAREYAELEGLLASLPLGPSDDRWHDDVLRAIAAAATPPRPWWRGAAARWMLGGGFATAAAIIALVVVLRTPARPELEAAIRHVDTTRGDAKEAVVGDRLIVTARPQEPGELRVYRSGASLVASCPGGPGCRAAPNGAYALEVTLDAPVAYQVILVVGLHGAPADGTMDSYLDAARAAHARIITYPAIDVH